MSISIFSHSQYKQIMQKIFPQGPIKMMLQYSRPFPHIQRENTDTKCLSPADFPCRVDACSTFLVGLTGQDITLADMAVATAVLLPFKRHKVKIFFFGCNTKHHVLCQVNL